MRTRWIIRSVAAFDLLATLPLALPYVAELYLELLLTGFGLWPQGDAGWLPLTQPAALFCNLAGILAVTWNAARWKRPQENWLVRFDVRARIVVATLLAGYLLMLGAPGMLWIFVFSELAGALLQALCLRRRAAKAPLEKNVLRAAKA